MVIHASMNYWRATPTVFFSQKSYLIELPLIFLEHGALPDIEAKYASLPKIEACFVTLPFPPTFWVLLGTPLGNTLGTWEHPAKHIPNHLGTWVFWDKRFSFRQLQNNMTMVTQKRCVGFRTASGNQKKIFIQDFNIWSLDSWILAMWQGQESREL